MLKPINGHIQVEPVVREGFMASQLEKYEEIGKVVAIDTALDGAIPIGSLVYFDSWLAAKFPKKVKGEFYWLVKYEDIRAIDKDE